MRLRVLPALLALAAFSLAACGSGGSSGGSTSATSASPTVIDTVDLWVTAPDHTTFSADPGVHQPLFSGTFEASAGQTRVVAALVSPTKPSARVFVGQEIGCVGPSGTLSSTPASGRNVTGSETTPILSALVLTTDEDGTWTCGSSVSVCVPGNCKSAGPDATVDVLTTDTAKTGYSVLAASTPLPDWSQQVRPGTSDLPISPGSSDSWTADVTLPDGVDRAGLAGTISITNCITPTFPSACAGVGPHATQGSAIVVPTVTVDQLAADGTSCRTYQLGESDGVYAPMEISWEEHHSQLAFIVRQLQPSNESPCTRDFTVTLTFEVKKGNGIVVERGTAAAPRSLVIVTPPLPNLILSENAA